MLAADSTPAFKVMLLTPEAAGLAFPELSHFPVPLPTTLLLGLEPAAAAELSRQWRRSVQVISDGLVLSQNCMYCLAPGLMLEVAPDGRCKVRPAQGAERPFDRLLLSLADSFGPQALAVVEAAQLEDWTQKGSVAGLHALRQAGGTVLARQAGDAAASAFAQALNAAGAADLVCSTAKLGFVLADLLTYGRAWALARAQAEFNHARAEAEGQARSGASLRTLFDSIGEGICIAERVPGEPIDFRYVEVNPAFERQTGLRDVVGHTMRELVPDIDEAAVNCYARVQESGVSESFTASGLGRKYHVEGVATGRPGHIALLFHDVTATRNAERALRESELQQRLTLQLVPALLWWADPVGREVTPGEGWKTYTGQTADEVKHFGWLDAIHPEDLGATRSALLQAFATGEPLELQHRIRGQRGEYRWHLVRHIPVRDEAGALTRWFGAAVDIHDLHSLQERQAFLLRLSDALRPLSDPVQIQEAAMRGLGRHLGVQRAFYGDAGADLDTLTIGPGYADGLAPLTGSVRFSEFNTNGHNWYAAGRTMVLGDIARDPQLSAQARAKFEAIGVQAAVGVPLVKDGKVRAVVSLHQSAPREWTPEELRLTEEVAERTWAAVERARAEVALGASEAKYRTLFESVDEGFAIVEVLPDEQGRVTDLIYREANRAFEEQSGLGLRGVIGQRAREVLPNIGPELYDVMTGVYQTGEAVRSEAFIADAGRWCTFQWLRIGGAGSPFIAGVFNDITERKQREQQQEFLLTFSDALRAEQSADAVAKCALDMLSGHLRLDRCYITSYYLDENRADVDYQLGNDSVPPLPDHFILSDYPEAFKTTFENTVVIEDEFERRGLSEAEKRSSAKLGMRAMVGATLRKENRPLWSLVVIDSRPRRWTPGEIALVEEAAERIWAATERVRADEALRTLNAELEGRVEERTQRLAALNTELAARTGALEGFAQLTRDLALETDRSALVRRAQELLLGLLPTAHTGYFELEGGVWRMRWDAGDLKNGALREQLLAGIPFESPGPFVPFSTRQPVYIDNYTPGQDVPAELTRHIHSTAGLPVLVGGEVIGVLSVGLFEARRWQPVDKTVLETVAQQLGLVLERSEAVRALTEEREALAAFAQFTELTADSDAVDALAQRAAEVLHTTLDVTSAAFFELREGRWHARYVSGALSPGLEVALAQGMPERTMSLAEPAERREPMFFERWDVVQDSLLPPVSAYQAAARYPLFPPTGPVSMLGMATTARSTWTEREKAVFRAVGDSFRLALERAARVEQLERSRERLADLNAELGTLITRTAHNLEGPATRLNQLLDSAADDLLPPVPVALQDELARLRGVTQDLRQLSRLEQQELKLEVLPLAELFGEVSSGAEAERTVWMIHPLPIVRADRVLLKEALDALLTFTLSKTRGARYVEVSHKEVEGEVWITVQDNGVGLEPEEAATLFDLAVRTEQTVPLLDGGGLAQVRRIMARHGGWAWAESQISGGKVVLAFAHDKGTSEFEALLWNGPHRE